MEEEAQELAKRLYELKVKIDSIFEGRRKRNSKRVPQELRLEILQVYWVHQGAEVLQEILNIPAKSIKNWDMVYAKFPERFTGSYKRKNKSKHHFVRQIVSNDSLVAHKPKKDYKKLRCKNSDYLTIEDMKRSMPPHILKECENIKTEIVFKEDGNMKITRPQRRRIVDMVVELGSSKPIALILGLNQRLIMNWKSTFNKVLEI